MGKHLSVEVKLVTVSERTKHQQAMLIELIFTLFGNVLDSRISYVCSTKLLYFMDYVTTRPPPVFISILPHTTIKSCFITYITFLVHEYIIFAKAKLAVPRLVHEG